MRPPTLFCLLIFILNLSGCDSARSRSRIFARSTARRGAILSVAYEDPFGQKFSKQKLDLANDVDMSEDITWSRGGKQDGRRSRRSNDNLLTIEVFAIADYSTYAKWLLLSNNDQEEAIRNINFHLAHVFTGVDEIYRGIQSSKHQYRVKVVGIDVVTRPEDSPYTEDVKDANNEIDLKVAFASLRAWVKANIADLPDFDVAVVLTSLEGTGPTGLATMNSACGEFATLIRDRGIEANVVTFAHEIAHTLGSHHDGQGNLCPAGSGYVMEALLSTGDMSNSRTFSDCSVEAFENFVSKLDARDENCLEEAGHASYIDLSPDAATKPGTVYSINHQCRQIYGNSSYYCSKGANTHERICTETYCKNGDECRRFGGTRAYDGTLCGDGRWCVLGRCVEDADAPRNSGTCLYGDNPDDFNMNGNPTKCSQIDKGLCKSKGIEDLCCQTCASLASSDPNCRYGDDYNNCQDIFQKHPGICSRDEDVRQGCCETCQGD